MTTNEIQAVCCKCGAGLKYPVTIGNKVYGSTCASKHLGINDIPDQWTGNYDDLKKEKVAKAAEREAENKVLRKEWGEKKAKIDGWVQKYFPDAKRVHKAFFKARGNWEENFIKSTARQIDIPLMGDLRDWTNVKYIYDRWNWEPKGLKSLSDKQMEIFERIENS